VAAASAGPHASQKSTDELICLKDSTQCGVMPGTEVIILTAPAPVDIGEAISMVEVLSIYCHHSADQVVVHRTDHTAISCSFNTATEVLNANKNFYINNNQVKK